MNGSGIPQITSAKIKLGDISPSKKVIFTNLSEDEEIIGKNNFHSHNAENVKVKKTSIDISRNIVSDTELCFSIKVDCSKVKGTINIDKVTLKGNRIHLEDNETNKEIAKKDLINLMHNPDYSSGDDYVSIGSTNINVDMDPITFTGSFKGGNKSSQVTLNKEGSFSGDIQFSIPSEAGNDLDNALYTINSIEINYTFTPASGASSKNSYKKDFTKRVAFVWFKNNVVLATNKDYLNHYATAFYATKETFQFNRFKYIDDKRSPLIIKAFLITLMQYGIEQFTYDIKNLLAASRINDKGAFLYLINFAFIYNKKLKIPAKINVTLKYMDKGNVKTDTNNELDHNGLLFSASISSIKSTYAMKFQLDNNTDDFKNFYFFVEKKEIAITVLGADTVARSDMDYWAVKRGSSHSFMTSFQTLEQIEGGISSVMAQQSIDDLLAYLPFSFFGLGLFFDFAITMSLVDVMWALVFAELNWKSSAGMIFFNTEKLHSSHINEENVRSFVGRGTNLKANLNTDNDFRGAHIKSGLFTDNNAYFSIGMFIGEYMLLVDEINIPSYPYTATFNISANSDIFDPTKNIVLTSELKNWVRLTLNTIFSVNYALSKMFTTIQTPNDRIKKKPIHKRLNLVKTIKDIPINPFIDFENNKLVANLDYKDFISGNKDKIINDLNDYLDDIVNNQKTKNKLLVFICQQLLMVIKATSPAHLKKVIIASEEPMKTGDKKIVLLFNNDIFSPPVVYDIDKNTLNKIRTRHVLPSKTGENTSSERKTDSDIYYYTDEYIEFCGDIKEFFKKTDRVPNFSPSLFI